MRCDEVQIECDIGKNKEKSYFSVCENAKICMKKGCKNQGLREEKAKKVRPEGEDSTKLCK